MLNALEITNYQSHKNSILEFHKGMNVITGSSSHGKSAIMRAIIWGLQNRPSGGAFKNWDATDKESVEVAFEFNNGWFSKDRVGTKNKYHCEEGAFEALRSDVPDPIKEIANITDYNIQTQHQNYYMLQDSPGDRAKLLNSYVGLDIIDRIFKKLNSRIDSSKKSSKNLTDEISTLQEQIGELNYLGTVEQMIIKMTDDIDRHSLTSGKANALSESIGKMRDLSAQIAHHRKFLQIEPKCIDLNKRIGELAILKEDAAELQSNLAKIQSIKDEIIADKDWLIVEKPYVELAAKITERSVLVSKRDALLYRVKTHNNLTSSIEQEQFKLNDIINRYADMLSASGTCPTCASAVTPKVVTGIIKSLKE